MPTRAAVVQMSPVIFDRDATTEKVCCLTVQAARQGAQLVLFPEAAIPAYPAGLGFGVVVGSRTPPGRRLWERYWANSVDVPGPVTERLGETAREAGVYLAVGLIERDSEFARGTLYCTAVYFGPDGRLLGKHRKLKPTAQERVIWGEGDGSTLTVIDAPIGRFGALICWENYMPLARVAMYSKGVQIYLAPTADSLEVWQSTLRHIALEGRCFVLGCNQYFKPEMYPADLEARDGMDLADYAGSRGGSAIYSPMGECLAGPLWDQEGILLADLDLGEVVRGKFDLDVVGHYARPDVFQLIVNEAPQRPTVRKP